MQASSTGVTLRSHRFSGAKTSARVAAATESLLSRRRFNSQFVPQKVIAEPTRRQWVGCSRPVLAGRHNASARRGLLAGLPCFEGSH